MALASLEDLIRDLQVIQHHSDPQTGGTSTDDGDWEVSGSAAAKGRKAIELDEIVPGEGSVALPLVAVGGSDGRVQAPCFLKRELDKVLGDFVAEGVVDHDEDGSQVRMGDTQNSGVAFIAFIGMSEWKEAAACRKCDHGM